MLDRIKWASSPWLVIGLVLSLGATLKGWYRYSPPERLQTMSNANGLFFVVDGALGVCWLAMLCIFFVYWVVLFVFNRRIKLFFGWFVLLVPLMITLFLHYLAAQLDCGLPLSDGDFVEMSGEQSQTACGIPFSGDVADGYKSVVTWIRWLVIVQALVYLAILLSLFTLPFISDKRKTSDTVVFS